MKVLAAGKSTRPARIANPRCGRAGSLGRWASTRGTPACRATRTLGAPAQSRASRRRWVAAGSERRTWSGNRAPSPPGPAGWRRETRSVQPSSTASSPRPTALPRCSCFSAVARIHSPSFFFSFFLSAFSFPTAIRAAPWEGRRRLSSLQTPARTGAGAASVG